MWPMVLVRPKLILPMRPILVRNSFDSICVFGCFFVVLVVVVCAKDLVEGIGGEAV